MCQSFSKLNKIFDYIFFNLGVSEDDFKELHAMYIGDNPSKWARTGLDKRKDLENVSHSWARLNLLAFTSSISVGVDFSIKGHFNSLVGIYTGALGLDADLFV